MGTDLVNVNRHQLLEQIWLCREEAFRHSGGLHHSRPTFTQNMRLYLFSKERARTRQSSTHARTNRRQKVGILSQWELLNVDKWNQLTKSVRIAQSKETFKRDFRQTKHWVKRMTRLAHQRKLQNGEGKKVQWTGGKPQRLTEFDSGIFFSAVQNIGY